MLKINLTHPEILNALGKAGHGAKVLIADGDYPVSTTQGKNAAVVHLNLSAGVVSCTQVLETLLPVLLIENAEVMDVPADRPEPPVWKDFRGIIRSNGYEIPLIKVERFSFYSEVGQDTTALIIQTGELRDYANLLLTVGSL